MSATPTKRPYKSRRTMPQRNTNYTSLNVEQQPCSSRSDVGALSVTSAADSYSPVCTGPILSTQRPRRYKRQDALTPAATIGEQIPTSAHRLKPASLCAYCGAKKIEGEPPAFCCGNGTVKVATNCCPPELLRLYTSTDEDALHFQTYSRLYNNLFAFSSLAGQIDCETHRGIYVFRLHGQLYHFLPNLIPENNQPKYMQLYFYDAQFEQRNRCSFFQELRHDIVDTLMKIMDKNPYAKFFKTLRELPIDEHTTIHINKDAVLDQRVYNAPTSDEVAAIWSDWSAEEDHTGPYIVVTGQSNKVHRLKHYYGCYDPLQYPLLFPFGDNGWHPGIQKISLNMPNIAASVRSAPVHNVSNADALLDAEDAAASATIKKGISCREYYAYILQIRVGSWILKAARLLLQFVVDMYVKIENSRLDFFRNNQPTIRADLYQGIIDTLTAGENQGANAGRRIVLPPSFIGGPRDMRRRYLNAMALVQRFGKPDIFATMTCNPNWPEIKAELAVGEKAQNRPDLIARIFHSKLRLARKEIMDKKIFGEVAALIYVVEFQKRGLPHAHFLIILKPSHKIKTPEDFDRFVSAEIPSTENAYLRATVLSHMMHGPCGIANPNCPCMKFTDGKRTCKSRYPKAFTEYTTSQDDGYPTYKRRNTGETVRVRQYHMDNRWVIPYNPYLLAMFDCHFNVEVCSTIQAVKYLYKYVYKGHDRISFNIGQDNSSQLIDEIDNFQSGRWVSPPEVVWRIFGFDLYEMYPYVMPLHIHCENLQSVSFAPAENLEAVVSNPQRCQTPLTEFFRINKEQHPRPNYLYSEFPEHYVWDGRRKTWKPRKKGKMIGRLTFVGPSETERFFLRLLLINVRGPTSFSDLKTVDGYECASFQEACIQRGIIEQSDAADKCLEEATAIAMPSALRTLYATLLIFCNPPNPTYLWNKYYHSLSEDFRHLHPHSEAAVLSMTAEKIEQHLELMGKQLSDFGLDHLKEVQTEQSRITRDVRDAYNSPVSVECSEARKQLNSGQRHVYKAIVRCVKSNSSGVFFVDGPGGTGKTFLYCAIYAKVRLMGKIALATASSGIAAGCLPNGRTAHSRFKLPLDLNKGLACAVPKQGSLAKLLQETTLIIWDEAPMANKANIHALDLLLKDICTSEQPFGGKIVVFGGDFRQVLPVLPHKPQIEAVQASLASSSLWIEFTRFYLYQNMRAKEDPSFASFLLQLGNGKY